MTAAPVSRVRLALVLGGQRGALDVTSLLVGALVSAVFAAVIFATATPVVNWSQDQKAKQNLAAVVTAESVHRVQTARFTDYYTLVGHGLVPDEASLSVAVNVAGTCYAATSRSSTGKLFYATDAVSKPTDVQPAALRNWTTGTPLYGACEPTPVPPPPPPPQPVDWRELVKPSNVFTRVISVAVDVISTRAFCLNVSVAGTEKNAHPWGVTVDTSLPPFYGQSDKLWTSHAIMLSHHEDGIWYIDGKGNPASAKDPWNDTWNNSWMNSDSLYSFALCNSKMDAAPDMPDAYTVSVDRSTVAGQWGGRTDCMVATVRGTGAYPFYTGWAATVDMSAALDDFSARNLNVASVSWSPDRSPGQTVTPLGDPLTSQQYVVTSGRDNSVIGDETTVFALCVNAGK